ncbi:hypothetical protein HELRODRAFT_164002 [Helobdella robusta]|uniref:Uncharacterized protein n=1 Tax=Helobdella robusta TaxID=6412 RepID=T1EUR1_HELRO|nr:hypothetical protein HELRODRAFT_164002 [Helobdella robusta]ESN94205.1 hypothetical protein HELRODRAFT_164002 [Helobdella robusta]
MSNGELGHQLFFFLHSIGFNRTDLDPSHLPLKYSENNNANFAKRRLSNKFNRTQPRTHARSLPFSAAEKRNTPNPPAVVGDAVFKIMTSQNAKHEKELVGRRYLISGRTNCIKTRSIKVL